MKPRDWAPPLLLITAGVVAAGFYLLRSAGDASAPVQVTNEVPAADPDMAAEAAPAPQFPVSPPGQADDDAAPLMADLPALADSDSELRQSLIGAMDQVPIDAFLVPQQIVRRFVATIDNLDAPSLPMRLRALRRIDGSFAVQPVTVADAADPQWQISASNPARYAGFVEAVQLADVERLVQLYRRYYPLFQAAYEELGHGSDYFNDRLIQVIDHLLATPEVPAPVLLQRPKVLYQFADPELESRSAGQKALIRIGSENAEVIKGKLRQLRTELVASRTP